MSLIPSPHPDASGTVRGLVSLVAQTFAGIKTFAARIIAAAGISIQGQLNWRNASAVDKVASYWDATGSMLVIAGNVSGAAPWVTVGDADGILRANYGIITAQGISTGNVINVGSSAIIINPFNRGIYTDLGAGASDVALRIGTTVADATVSATAKLLALRTGITGTEVDYVTVSKNGTVGLPMGGASSWSIDFGGSMYIRTGVANIASFNTSGNFRSAYNIELNPGFGAFLSLQLAADGRVNQRGTDSSASPGAQTADRAIGKNAIAAGASSVVVTNNLVTAASVILITPHARDATCKELIAVPAAGSFTVSGSANATAALAFSWEVKGLL
jgi:hypothetical protein